MKHCPSDDFESCPYAKLVNGEIMCSLKHPEDDCDDYWYLLTHDDEYEEEE